MSVTLPLLFFYSVSRSDQRAACSAADSKCCGHVASYGHAAYLLVCAAKLVIPFFDNLKCSFPELGGNTGWARQRPFRPEPHAEVKEVCEAVS